LEVATTAVGAIAAPIVAPTSGLIAGRFGLLTAPALADAAICAAQRDMSLRWILLHLVEETARHLGHIDLLRERADGSTGEEPTQ
jgi:hypothetical protein